MPGGKALDAGSQAARDGLRHSGKEYRTDMVAVLARACKSADQQVSESVIRR